MGYKDDMVRLLNHWTQLQSFLMNEASERDCLELLAYEKKHKNRRTTINRLHSRYNRLRYLREREEIKV